MTEGNEDNLFIPLAANWLVSGIDNGDDDDDASRYGAMPETHERKVQLS